MNPERWKQIDELLDALFDLEPPERMKFLKHACGSDEDLRKQVELLLTSDYRAKSFIETAAARAAAGWLQDSSDPTDLSQAPGPVQSSLTSQQVVAGRYRLLSLLGKGGVGEVWRAFDAELQIDVALKALRMDKPPTGRAGEALRQEVLIARKVNSPHVCRIYDLVIEEGRELVSMEFVDGTTLHDRMKEKGPLTLQEASEISSQFLAGLAAIHDAGLVHRDFKPENIMITRTGRVIVMDLGIAKHVTEVTGTMAGTPPYMAPEQLISGKVDARCDIFAAGVVLAEMINPEGAMGPAAREKLWNAIRMDPPRLPESAWKTVIARAVASNPDHRFSSVKALADSLNRATQRDIAPHSKVGFTTDALRRLRVFPQSTRSQMTAALALLSIFVLALFASRSQMFDRYKPSSLPQEKYLAILPFANIGGNSANQAFCDGLVETLASKLTELEQFHGTLWVVPTSELRNHEIATVAEARKDLAVTLAITGSVQRNQDEVRLTANLVDAKTLRQLRAITIRTSIQDSLLQDDLISQIAGMMELEVNPRARDLITLASTSVGRAYDYYVQGEGYLARSEKAENIDAALAMFEQAKTLDRNFALAYAGLAKAYWQKYDLTKEQKWVDLSQENCKHGLQLNDRIAPAHVMLGVIQNGTGKYEEAVLEFKRALILDPANFEAYLGLANSYSLMQDSAMAELTYKRAIIFRPNVWLGYNRLGAFYYMSARLPEAAGMFEKVIELVPDSFRGYSNLGGIYIVEGRYPEAIAVLEKSASIRPNADAYWNLGYTYYVVRRFPDAASNYEKAVKIEPQHYSIWGGLADSYFHSPGQRQRASDAYQRAIQLAEQELKLNPRDTNALISLSYFYAKTGAKSECFQRLEYALSLAPDSAESAFYAALVYNQFGQSAAALEYLERAVKRNYPVSEIRNRVEFDNLHDNPAFRALISEPTTD